MKLCFYQPYCHHNDIKINLGWAFLASDITQYKIIHILKVH